MADQREIPPVYGRPGLVPNANTSSGYEVIDASAVQVRSRPRSLAEIALDALAAIKSRNPTLGFCLDRPWS